MSKSLHASSRALRLTLGEEKVPETVDVHFDGHRVWSTGLTRSLVGGTPKASWPAALRPYLKGRTTISVTDSATGTEVAQGEVRFPGEGRVSVTDARGRWLAMNKWDRLGPSFSGSDTGVQDRLLANAVKLCELLQGWGYPVYIVGGTLLGAVRTGQMIPHDDDIDLAWLCEETSFADISLASYEMERRLAAEGLVMVRHSLAHLQVTYFTDSGETDHYIDIFTGFYHEGLYNQPFALRGELDRDELVPTSEMTLNGVPLPAPRRPEGWLRYAYGPSWRVPDPAFKFVTPQSTLRLFETHFGVYNRQRVWWEKYYETQEHRPQSDEAVEDVEAFLELLPAEAQVVEIGCGDGRLTERIAAAGHHVRAYDYSYEALRLARQTQPDNVEYGYLNVNDRNPVIKLALELIDEGRDTWFFGSRLLHDVPMNGRESIFMLMNAVLNDRTCGFFTFYSDPHPRREDQNPETWHLDMASLHTEARRFGVSVRVVDTERVRTPYGQRTKRTVIAWR